MCLHAAHSKADLLVDLGLWAVPAVVVIFVTSRPRGAATVAPCPSLSLKRFSSSTPGCLGVWAPWVYLQCPARPISCSTRASGPSALVEVFLAASPRAASAVASRLPVLFRRCTQTRTNTRAVWFAWLAVLRCFWLPLLRCTHTPKIAPMPKFGLWRPPHDQIFPTPTLFCVHTHTSTSPRGAGRCPRCFCQDWGLRGYDLTLTSASHIGTF
jgi:hypothetical protein